jgi:hypothetical protein
MLLSLLDLYGIHQVEWWDEHKQKLIVQDNLGDSTGRLPGLA